MTENRYQADLIKRLDRMFPGSVILKNDSGYLQGIPDLTFFWGPVWAWLEVKAYEGAPEQPNQHYYIDLANQMGAFGAFIYPENEEEVLNALQQASLSRWAARNV